MYINYKDDPLKYYGEKKKDNYFEGWYFKHVSSDLKNIISVIPGISKNLNDPHSFIQTIIYTENNGKKVLLPIIIGSHIKILNIVKTHLVYRLIGIFSKEKL